MTRWKDAMGVLMLVIVVMSLAACAGQPTQSTPVLSDNLVYSRQSEVQFLAAGNTSRASIDTNHRQDIKVGDAVTVDDNGQARLRFSDYLAIDVYRNTDISEIQYTASVEPDTPPAFRMRLEGGSVFSNLNTQDIASQRVKPEYIIDTKWAVIKALGTRFWVHYDEDREITWVVVKEGEVSVTGAGVEVIVPAGYQTWVEPNKAPLEPILACRDLIGDMFPLIDELTNQDRQDLELLCEDEQEPGTAQQITPTVQVETVVPTVTRRPPSAQPSPSGGTVLPTVLPQVVCPVIQLNGPNDGAIFIGLREDVTLAWQPDRQLAPDEYFVVTSTFDHNGEIWTDTQQTTQAGLTLPIYLKDLMIGARQLEWNVSVWRKDRTGAGSQICPASSSRRLIWEEEPPPADTAPPEHPVSTPSTGFARSAEPASPWDTVGLGVMLGASLFLALIWVSDVKHKE